MLVDLLTDLGDRGLVALVKIDGERPHARWTIVVSGPPLGEEPVRWDGDDLDAGLVRILTDLSTRMPGQVR